VTCLEYHPHLETVFFSASKDNTIRAWCIERFTELYCFDLALDSMDVMEI
jgi:hypothetical protein